MRIASVVTALGLAAAAFAMPAAAQKAGGWYIGYNAGQSKYNLSCPAGSSCKDTGAGYSFFAGVNLHPNIAAEFGYTDLGKTTFGPSNLRANVWHASAVGSWWFGPRQTFGVYGRLGAYTGDLKATAPSTGAEIKHGSTNLLYGVGGQWNLSTKFGARLEWERFASMGGGGFNQTGDVDLISLGLLYKF
jgi:opacity protein-like surface antigen